MSDGTAPVPELAAHHLWKVFGTDAKTFAAKGGAELGSAEVAAHGWVPALADVSLHVATGEVLVVMGLSGSGKSTLVRCLTALLEPTVGSVEFRGTDLMAMSAKELNEVRRNHMGMVFQHFALLPNRTVLRNVAFPLEVQGRDRAAREQRARELIELVGLTGREGRYPSELSGGQQQRVGIARSLAVDPSLWFLDEPFSSLDPLIRHDLQEELLRLQRQLRKTIVFITHDLDEAIKLADRIVLMDGGRVIQEGSAEELVLRPANDYVRRFTAKVDLAKVVTARTLAVPLTDQRPDQRPLGGVTVAARDRLHSFAPIMIESDVDPVVIDDDGNPIGIVDRRRALRALAGVPE